MQKYKWHIVIGIWVFAVILTGACMLRTDYKILESEIVNGMLYESTEELYQEDSISFSMYDVDEVLSSVELAFVYEADSSDRLVASIKVQTDGELLVEELIQVNTCINQSFFVVDIPQQVSDSHEYEIVIENVSDTADEGFSLCYTSVEVNYLDYIQCYSYNEEQQSGQLISRFTYCTGYNWYALLSCIYYGLIIASLTSTAVLYYTKKGITNQ